MDLLRGQRSPPRKKKISFLIIRTTEKGEKNNQPAGIFAGSDFVKVFRDMARANAVRHDQRLKAAAKWTGAERAQWAQWARRNVGNRKERLRDYASSPKKGAGTMSLPGVPGDGVP